MYNYPYTDFHELNLDWILEQIKDYSEIIANAEQIIKTYNDRLSLAEQTATIANSTANNAQQTANNANVNATAALQNAATAYDVALSAIREAGTALQAAQAATQAAQLATQTAQQAQQTTINFDARITDAQTDASEALSLSQQDNTKIGNLQNLTTQNKQNLVAAINEVAQSGGGGGGGGGVSDVQINGASIVNSGVANIPTATLNNLGVVKVDTQYDSQYGVYMALTGTAAYRVRIATATDARIKAGAANESPITPVNQHKSVFYGLAKAAGDNTQAASSNPVGTYTDDAKAAIRSMLGINIYNGGVT